MEKVWDLQTKGPVLVSRTSPPCTTLCDQMAVALSTTTQCPGKAKLTCLALAEDGELRETVVVYVDFSFRTTEARLPADNG